MVQWGPGPDAFFMLSMMKVHNIKPNYQAIAANMGDNFTNRALGHRMDALRNMAEQYISTMALQADAQAPSPQADLTLPAKGKKRGPSAATPTANVKAKSTTTAKASNEKATTKTSASKNKVVENPVKAMTNAGVKKRGTAGVKGKMGSKTEKKGKKEEDGMKGEGEDTDATITDVEADAQGEDEDGEAEEMECA